MIPAEHRVAAGLSLMDIGGDAVCNLLTGLLGQYGIQGKKESSDEWRSRRPVENPGSWRRSLPQRSQSIRESHGERPRNSS
jgi:hypothetical protein